MNLIATTKYLTLPSNYNRQQEERVREIINKAAKLTESEKEAERRKHEQ